MNQIVKNSSLTPWVICHRGARKYAPENTIPAFKKAAELGVDGVEFDVMSTLDGIPVVVHDNNLHKLSSRHILVHKTPLSELKKIDVGSHFNPFFADERIPTLKEVLDVLSLADPPLKIVNIELKEQPKQHADFIPQVGTHIQVHKNAILVSSFSRALLSKFHKTTPNIPCAILLMPRAFFFLRTVFSANISPTQGLNPHISMLSKPLVRYAKRKSLRLITWTANTKEQICHAINMGVDGIITDEPVLAQEIIYGRK